LLKGVEQFSFAVEQLTDGSRVGLAGLNEFFSVGEFGDEFPLSPFIPIVPRYTE
jgi:hypothetical protein